jgi:protein TonB|nr:TonB family protein [uncultured Brevundimonas sp.]
MKAVPGATILNAVADGAPRRFRARARGPVALGVALALHAAPLLLLINLVVPAPIPIQEPPAIVVELVRSNAAPPRPPSEQIDGPKQIQAVASRPIPRPPVQMRVQAEAPEAVNIPVAPPVPRAAERQTPAPATTAPVSRPAPPAPSASTSPQDWKTRVLAHLDSKKRYPPAARRLRQEGVVLIRFTMDRSGRVLTSRIERGSGRPLLDREALAMLQRAQPLPPPPDDVPGSQLDVVAPIEFFLTQ